MMTTVLLIRHGQSVTNISQVFTGHYDVPLSPLGQEQARRTAAYLHANYRVDAVYASDLMRAMQTAQPTAETFGLEIRPDFGLREISAGEWERMPFTQIEREYPEVYACWRHDIGRCTCPGGESVAHLFDRVQAAVDRIAAVHPDQTVAIFTHATPIRALQCRWQGGAVQDMRDISFVPNASVTAAQGENGVYRLIAVGECGFLNDLKTSLPDNV